MIKETHTLTMNTKDLEALLEDAIGRYDKQISDKVNDQVNKVLRDKEVYIYCVVCGKNILFEKEPTVFGSRNGSKSGVHHMECWQSLEPIW